MKVKSRIGLTGIFYMAICLSLLYILIGDLLDGFEWNIGTAVAFVFLVAGSIWSLREILWNFKGYYLIERSHSDIRVIQRGTFWNREFNCKIEELEKITITNKSRSIYLSTKTREILLDCENPELVKHYLESGI